VRREHADRDSSHHYVNDCFRDPGDHSSRRPRTCRKCHIAAASRLMRIRSSCIRPPYEP
jgi:hypothetical protein